MKKIYISGDHAGFKLKEKLKPWLEKKGFKIKDFGPHKYKENDDYPDYVIPMANAVVKNKVIGIITAGSGEGEGIAVNKLKGVRAIVYHGKNLKIIKISREHNNANILSLGSRFVTENESKKAIEIFLKTKFSGGRHRRRMDKISKLGGF